MQQQTRRHSRHFADEFCRGGTTPAICCCGGFSLFFVCVVKVSLGLPAVCLSCRQQSQFSGCVAFEQVACSQKCQLKRKQVQINLSAALFQSPPFFFSLSCNSPLFSLLFSVSYFHSCLQRALPSHPTCAATHAADEHVSFRLQLEKLTTLYEEAIRGVAVQVDSRFPGLSTNDRLQAVVTAVENVLEVRHSPPVLAPPHNPPTASHHIDRDEHCFAGVVGAFSVKSKGDREREESG